MNHDGSQGTPHSGPADQVLPPTFLQRYGISPVLFAFMLLILVFVLYQVVGGIITFLLFGANFSRTQVGGLRVATLAGQFFFILIPAILLTRLATTAPTQFLRIRSPRLIELAIPLFGVFSLQQMLQVYMVYQEKIPTPESLSPLIEQLKQMIEEAYRVLVSSSSVPELFFVLLVIALTPAIAEEVLFRGVVQRSLERGLGRRRGLVLTAIIFASYHLNPFSFLPLLALGLYLGFLVHRSNNLWVSVAAHFYNNTIACVAVYFGMSDDFVVTGTPASLSDVEMFLTFVVFSLVFVVSSYYFMQVTKQQRFITQA